MFILLVVVALLSIFIGIRNLNLTKNDIGNISKKINSGNSKNKNLAFKDNLNLEMKYTYLEKRIEDLEKIILEDSILIEQDYDKIKEMVYKNDSSLNSLSIDEIKPYTNTINNDKKNNEKNFKTSKNSQNIKLNKSKETSTTKEINENKKNNKIKTENINLNDNKFNKEISKKSIEKANEADDIHLNTQINREFIEKIRNEEKLNEAKNNNIKIYENILRLEEEGKSVDEICKELNLNTGEVILLKNLYKSY